MLVMGIWGLLSVECMEDAVKVIVACLPNLERKTTSNREGNRLALPQTNSQT